MSNFERYKFYTTQEAAAAAERLTAMGLPRDGVQLMRLEMVVDKRVVRDLREVREVVRYYGGEADGAGPETETASPPQWQVTPEYYFETPEAAREVAAQCLSLTGCRDASAAGLSADGGLRLDSSHFFHDRPTPACGGDTGVGGHRRDWNTVGQLLAARGAMTLEGYVEWKIQQKEAEERFEAIKRQAEDELRRTNDNLPLDRVKIFKFKDPKDITEVTELLIRLGVPGRAIQTEIKGLVLVSKKECESIWPDVEAAVARCRGTRVRGGVDTFCRLIDHLGEATAELHFEDEEGAKKIAERLEKEGTPAESVSLEGGGKLTVRKDAYGRLKATAHDLKSERVSLQTRLGRVKI